MNWVRENKFMASVAAVLCGGGALLCFLIYHSWARYSEALESHQRQSASLAQLKGMVPYPDAENLAKFKEQQELLLKNISGLKSELLAMQVPVESLKPEEFQDRLRASVSAIVAKADAQKIAIADKPKFYLGFGQFQVAPPKAEETGSLAVQLKAIERLMELLIESRVEELSELKIGHLENKPQSKPVIPGAKAVPVQSALVKSEFEVGFLCDPAAMRRVVNAISGVKEQLLVIRDVRVENTSDKGPSRAEQFPSAAPNTGGSGDTESASMKFIVGTEKLKVWLKIELVQFAKES